MLNVILNGANGRMGRVINRLISEREDMKIVAGVMLLRSSWTIIRSTRLRTNSKKKLTLSSISPILPLFPESSDGVLRIKLQS
jgi:dihydrodipicolinate reductase